MSASDGIALLDTTLTAAGVAFGLYQYRRNSEREDSARRRERAVMATSQTRDFFAHPSVRLAMELLDHGLTPFIEALKDRPPFR